MRCPQVLPWRAGAALVAALPADRQEPVAPRVAGLAGLAGLANFAGLFLGCIETKICKEMARPLVDRKFSPLMTSLRNV